MAREALLDKVPIAASHIHRIQGELPPEQAAAAYDAELEAVLGAEGRFDLILLGMGTDGHTASLFPGTTALEEQERAVVAVYVERLRAWRVTLFGVGTLVRAWGQRGTALHREKVQWYASLEDA